MIEVYIPESAATDKSVYLSSRGLPGGEAGDIMKGYRLWLETSVIVMLRLQCMGGFVGIPPGLGVGYIVKYERKSTSTQN